MESINRNARVVLTSHRLLRLCILLCTACNSMLSVRRISWRSLYMFGFAKRPNSAEKCDSSSSGDNWMPQIGQELWPVADVGPMCMGFLGPIPVGAKKAIFTHQLKFFCVLSTTSSIINFSLIFRPLNMISVRRIRTKKSVNQLMHF